MPSLEMEFWLAPATVRMYFNEGEGTYSIYKAVEGENSGDVRSYLVGTALGRGHAAMLFRDVTVDLIANWRDRD